jgi:endoglucanase
MRWWSRVIPALSLLSLQVLAQDGNSGSATTSSASATSVTGTPNKAYTTLLSDSLLFYEAQRSGHLPSNNRVPW